METKTVIKNEAAVVNNRYVFSRDGVRMTYDEWLDMITNERN